ncbi:MAG TPA: hypothetical protein VGI74_04195, partial [Streptosporangiaceae bacterium]
MAYSNIEFNPQEAELFLVLTGERPPEFNTDGGHEAAQILMSYADMVDNQLTPLVQARVNAAQTGMSGEMSKSFVANLEQYTVASPFILPTTSNLARQLGVYTDSASDQAQSIKIQAIVALAVLIAAFIVDAIIAFFDPAAGIEAAVAEEAATRVFLEALLDALKEMIFHAIPIGIAIQVGQDTLAQIIEMAEGIEKNWNWTETLEQVGIGALGGAMGSFLKPLEEKLTGNLTHLLENMVNSGGKDLTKDLGKDLGNGLDNNVGHDGAGGPGAGDHVPGGAGDHMPGGAGDHVPADPGAGDHVPGDPGPGGSKGPSWTPNKPPVGSAGWWLHNLASIPVGILIGGIHNAGHATLWNLMTTGQLTWDWGTFMGGAAYGVAHPLAVMAGGGARMAVGVTAPAENLIAAAFGSVTPQHLTDIASATESPGGTSPGTGSGAQGGDVSKVPNESEGESSPLLVPPTSAGPGLTDGIGSVNEPPVVQLLRNLNVPVGPDAAYNIALRTGMVPVVGPVTAHPLYESPLKVNLPASTSLGSVASKVMGTISGNPGRPLAEIPVESVQPHELATLPQDQLPPPLLSPDGAPLVPGVPAPVGSHEPLASSPLDESLPPEVQQRLAPPLLTPQVRPQDSVLSSSGPTEQQAPVSETPVTHEPVPVEGEHVDELPPTPVGPAPTSQQIADALRDGGLGPKDVAEEINSGDLTVGRGPVVKQPEVVGSAEHVPGVAEIGHSHDLPHDGQPGERPEVRVGVPEVLGRDGNGAADTWWAPVRDGAGRGWHVARHDGLLDRGSGTEGQQRPLVRVPAGSKALLDGSGQAQHVVLRDGISYERGLDGRWGPPRKDPGDLIVVKTSKSERLKLADGTTVRLKSGNELVRDKATGQVVAYRQVKGGPRLFLPDGERGWAEHDPADAAVFEGWLAAANKAHDAARALSHISALSGPEVPRDQRLTELPPDALKDLLHNGSPQDQLAALYEWVRRSPNGVPLRWTQIDAIQKLMARKVINMDAGEGKSWVFFVHSALLALHPEADAVHYITTRGNLADREFRKFKKLLSPLGYDVHRINSNKQMPVAEPGKPTIYVGTSEDVAFTVLKTGQLPGGNVRIHASIDEIDEGLKYANSRYIISSGAAAVAPKEVADRVRAAWESFTGHLDSKALGSKALTPADFGRTREQWGPARLTDTGSARLTEAGLAKLTVLLGRPPTEAQVNELNMAATAHWDYANHVHYQVHAGQDEVQSGQDGVKPGKVYIIDQTTHQVMFNPETSTEGKSTTSESRWTGNGDGPSLAQMVEAKEGLAIRADSATSKSLTAQELYAKPRYESVVGASGTAAGHDFSEIGATGVEKVNRYYQLQLQTPDDHVSPNEGAKLDAMAAAARAGRAENGRPQLLLVTRNDQAAGLSKLLDEMGVPHTAIDAKWILENQDNLEAAFNAEVEKAGELGSVLVGNMQLSRGVDFPVSAAAKALGGIDLLISGRSASDISIQAMNRVARSGEEGRARFFTSPEDEAYALSRNPDVQ